MKTLLIVIMSAVIVSGCARSITSLPQTTQTGSNTFGAKINGSPWGPMKMVIVQSVPIIEARFGGNNSVTINARNFGSSPTETEMEIHLKNITGPGTYQLNQNTAVYPNESASYAHFVRRRVRPMEEWITNSQLGGSVTITKFDPENKIISGIFEFQAANILGGSAPITVTDGRFDVRIQ